MAGFRPTVDNPAMIQRHDDKREQLRNSLQAADITATAASKAIGKKADFVRDYLTGRKEDMAASAWADLAKLLKNADLAVSEQSSEPLGIKLAPVRGETAAGRWLEFGADDHENYDPVPCVPTRYGSVEQFAFRVFGPSMTERQIYDGDYVICVPYWIARETPQTGDIVVVERRRGQLMERTCKELAVERDRFLLWSRTDDPRYASPIVVDRGDGEKDDEHVEVIGLVVGRYSPM